MIRMGNSRASLNVDWSMDRPKSSEPRPKFPRPGLPAWFLVALIVGALAWHLVFSRNIEAFTTEELRELANQATDWIRAERQAQRPFASPLAPSELEIFGHYFPRPVLEDARVLGVAEMPSPRFVGAIRYRGRKIFDLSQALGLALGDTILLRGANVPAGSPARRSVLFHELVHSLQYRALGVESFIENYLASLVAAEYRYADIVFEHQAFELQHRFMVHPDQPFSVALEVERLVTQLNRPN